ncbi:hypothetical protein F5Y18DRAFT_375613 [Xylariaceae sp. FL1019]|nr:hypothetical protein F5Y18DRAFT_375613 [Xylariaceae sp. FL1019]
MQPLDRLDKIPEAKAKTILIALCSDDSSLHRKATKYLDQMESLERSATANQPGGLKRKASSTIKICVQCQEPFYEEENTKTGCRYHKGELEVDYESGVWDDHDEDCFGPRDTAENRRAFPEGFIWSCCDRLGHRSGCKTGKHSSDSGQRGRYDTTPGTDSEADYTSSSVNGESSEEGFLDE